MKTILPPIYILLLFFIAGLSDAPAIQAAGVEESSQHPSFVRPMESSAVDVAPWAFKYRKDSTNNPYETVWLDARPNTLCGCLWEERRPISRIEVEFAKDAKFVPDAKDLSIALRGGFAISQKTDAGKIVPAGGPETRPDGGRVFTFQCGKEINALKVLYSGDMKLAEQFGIPVVRAFNEKSHWRKPLPIEIEWGFQNDKPEQRWDGRLEVYNGYADKIAPLDNDGGVTVTGEYLWKDGQSTSARRGLKTQVYLTAGPVDTRTIVTLWTSGGDVSFSVEDLDKGPILIPGVGIYVTKADGGMPARDFQKQLASKQLLTVRQQVRQKAEENCEIAMQRYHANETLPPFPTPPYEPPMKIDVPEKQIADQWRLGYWHLKRWSKQLDDKTYCVSIWPFTTTTNPGGMVAIGIETWQILRTLDVLGAPDIAQGGLNYWINGDHVNPTGLFVDLKGKGLPLANAFNSPNHKIPGYDQHAAGGHGTVLNAAGIHCRFTENNAWFDEVKPVLEKACAWTLLQREAWNKNVPKNTWVYGIEPPTDLCDGSDVRLFYAIDAWYYAGLKSAAQVLAEHDPVGQADLLKEVEAFRKDIRAATDRSMALSPVTLVSDGTYRRYVPFQPYMRGLGYDIPTGMNVGAGPNSTWFETTMGGILLVRSGIYDIHESVVQEMLDVYEDKLVKNGQNIQNGYNDGPAIHLMLDDVPLFLRGVYNGYAMETMPERGYVFRECAPEFYNGGEADKTFEEAAFLERVRDMLVMEENQNLWLARATPRVWLEQGKRIAVTNAPTYFGTVDYEIVSDVDHGKINAKVKMPSRDNGDKANEVWLRLRHPKSEPIQSVRVNGQSWKDFDVAKEIVRLHDVKETATVEVNYAR